MAQLICPNCGAEHFLASKTGSKMIFKVESGRVVQCIQSSTGSFREGDINVHNICCGACSWHGSLDELVELERD